MDDGKPNGTAASSLQRPIEVVGQLATALLDLAKKGIACPGAARHGHRIGL